MALSAPSLFNYGIEITTSNQYITFKKGASDTRLATVQLGFYSITGLMNAVITALQAADPLTPYSYTVNRNVAGGTQNRITIISGGSYFQLLFASGNPSNPSSLMGFNVADYTGSLTYSGSSSAGFVLIPNQLGYNYLSPTDMNKNFGMVNISASGLKEAIVFSIQQFFQVQFKYIQKSVKDSDWQPLVLWLIQQREFEFTPEITSPNVFYVATLEGPDQGLMFNFQEMLPDFPNNYQTPLNQYRVRNES